MMPVNHVQSRVRHVTVLADAGSLPGSESNMLTAVDLMATGVIVDEQFLNVTYTCAIIAITFNVIVIINCNNIICIM